MRVAILGDVHIDRNSRLEETEHILDRVTDELRDERPDLIIQVGDLFEGQTTPVERAVGDYFAMRMGEIAETVVVRGNHDAPGDILALGNLRTDSPLHTIIRPAIVRSASGVLVACLPHLAKPDLADLDGALVDFRERFRSHAGPTLLVGHFTLEGAQLSNGETMAHQGMSLAPAGLLDLGAQVVATGHIHLQQSFCEERAWHVGSVRRTDFGERSDEKGWILVEYSPDTGPRVTFRPIAQRGMAKIEAILTEDAWLAIEKNRPLPGEFEWPNLASDTEVWVLLHYPSDRQVEYRRMRDEAERRYPAARIDGRGIPVAERRSVEFAEVSATGLIEAFCSWRRSESDYVPLAASLEAKLEGVETEVGGFSRSSGPSADASEGLILGDLEFVGINGVVEPMRIPYSQMRGLICFAGPNGAGKTTSFEASLAALTREFGYYGKSIPDRVRGRASIAQSFRMGGKAYEARLLVDASGAKAKQEVWLTCEGRVINDPTKLTSFDDAIGELVGTKDLLELTIFARQADSPEGKQGFFNLAPADRTERIIALTGNENYQRVAELAGKARKALETPIAEERTRIDTIERRLADVEGLQCVAADVSAKVADAGRLLAEADAAVHAAIVAEAEIAALPGGAGAAERELAEKTTQRDQLRARYAEQAEALRREEETAGRRARVEAARQEAADCDALLGQARDDAAVAEADLETLQERQRQADQIATAIATKARARDALIADARQAHAQILASRREAVARAEAAVRLAEQRCFAAGRDPEVQRTELAVKAAARALDEAQRRLDEAHARAERMKAVPCAEMDIRESCELLAGARQDRDAMPGLEAEVEAAEAALADAHAAAGTAARAAAQAAEAAAQEAIVAEAKVVEAGRQLAEATAAGPDAPAEAQGLAEEIAALEDQLAEAGVAPAALDAERQAIAAARQRCRELEASLQDARDIAGQLPLVEAAEKRAAEIREDIARIEQEGLALKGQCEELQRRLDGLKDHERLVAEARETKVRAQEERDASEIRHGVLREALAALAGQIAQLEALRPELDEARTALARLSADHAEWSLIERGCGKTGLQALAVDAAGPELADLVNRILLDCHGPRWTFGLVTQVEKKDGKGVKDRFEPVIFDRGVTRDRVSGGEGAILDVAVRLALAVYNGRHSGRRYQVCWLDEAAQAVGIEHAAIYVRMLRLAAELGGLAQICIISHQSAVWGMCDWLVRMRDTRDGALPPAIEAIECMSAGGRAVTAPAVAGVAA